jgi:hypothetical protein
LFRFTDFLPPVAGATAATGTGPVLQAGQRLLYTQDVGGSSPSLTTRHRGLSFHAQMRSC